jgi:hypothetical protein
MTRRMSREIRRKPGNISRAVVGINSDLPRFLPDCPERQFSISFFANSCIIPWPQAGESRGARQTLRSNRTESRLAAVS